MHELYGSRAPNVSRPRRVKLQRPIAQLEALEEQVSMLNNVQVPQRRARLEEGLDVLRLHVRRHAEGARSQRPLNSARQGSVAEEQRSAKPHPLSRTMLEVDLV